jgi:D-tyrosyl-tRNA(Tyr) deacylase
MRAVIQRVTQASVHVEGQQVAAIAQGLCCLIGLEGGDGDEDMDWLVRKILTLRLFPGEGSTPCLPDAAAANTPTTSSSSSVLEAGGAKPWARNVQEAGGSVLCVSQFTLYASCAKGTKPDFHRAMGGPGCRERYATFIERMRAGMPGPERVQDGVFGAMMQVALCNDGPVTILLDSKNRAG